MKGIHASGSTRRDKTSPDTNQQSKIIQLSSNVNLIRNCVLYRNMYKGTIVPLYKGKGDKYDCKNHRGISLLSIPGKLYGRILIGRVQKMTQGNIWEVQCGFMLGRGWC
jgi:hypothetical protein